MRAFGHLAMFILRSGLTIHTVLFRWIVVYFTLRAWEVGLDLRRWVALTIAVLPIARSALALIAPLSPGPWFRWRHGYRLPSESEKQQIAQVLDTFPSSARRPSQVVILDGPGMSALTVGTTTVIERGLLATWLHAALAHQVGCMNATSTGAHLAYWWSKYQVLAAMADALHPVREPDDPGRTGLVRRILGSTLRLFSGTTRLVRWPERWIYPSLLKRDVYAADQWAASQIGSDDLERFLEAHKQPTDFSSPYPWLSEMPATEKRLEKLRAVG